MKIIAIVESIGLGHATRTLEALKEFRRQGWETLAVANNSAARYLEKNDVPVADVPLSIIITERDGKLDVGKSLFDNIKVGNFTASASIGRVLQKQKPDLILVDTSVIGMMAAGFYKNLKKTPVIFLGSDNRYKSGNKPEKNKQNWEMVDNFIQSTADAYVIPDMPPPYTITGYNLMLRKKMVFVGPLSWLAGRKIPESNEGVFFTQGKSELVSRHLPKIMKSKSVLATEASYEEKFLNSEVVVHHGGHTTAMECILAEKPQLIIPMEGYVERVNNGRKIEDFRLGRMIPEQWVDEKTVEYALEEIRTYKPEVKRFARYARSFDARKKIYEIGQSLL